MGHIFRFSNRVHFQFTRGSIAHMKTFNACFGARALLDHLLGSPFASILTVRLAAAPWLVATMLLCAVGAHAAEPTFTKVTATVAPGLPQVGISSVAWGDYDNDGRLDFLITGGANNYTPVSQLWRNTGSGFVNVTATVAPGLPGVRAGSVAWGDFDDDGRLDFLITGTSDQDLVSQLWRNTENGFTNVTDTLAPGLSPVASSSVAWGDFDNDGRLDFLIAGERPDTSFPAAQLWRNTGSGFTNVTTSVAPGLPGVIYSSVAWGDYDNDGRLDFLLTGGIHDGEAGYDPISQLWRNTESGFTNVTASVVPGLPAVLKSSVAWGDYDNDGRLDFLITGDRQSSSGAVAQLWRNTGSGFTNVTPSVAPGLPGVLYSSVAWGDYDNDSRLDFLLTGYSYTNGNTSQLWRNTASGFTNVTASVVPGLPTVTSSSVAWGDYDNDGRLDFLITGRTNFSGSAGVSQLWRNNTTQTNPPPEVIPTTFTNVTTTLAPGLTQVGHSSVAWADYDNDGRLDFLLTGEFYITTFDEGGIDGHEYHSRSELWRNTECGFTNVTATVAPGLPGVSSGSVAWGDYDNDGRLDFLLTGSGFSQLWRNTANGFTNVTATVAPGLPGVMYSSVAWGDYDNDGRLDFLLTGQLEYTSPHWNRNFISQVWRNTGNGFINVTATVAPGLPGVKSGAVAWGDYDNDGRLDFLLTGGIPRRTDQDDDTSLTPISQLWRNTGSGFANVTATVASGLTGVHWSSAAWGDYDNDGRLDLLISGWNRSLYRGVSQLWRNTGSGFANVTPTVAPGLPGTYASSVAWGDYDNDGRLDILLTGARLSSSQVWRNTGSGFTNVTASVAPGLPLVVHSSAAWGDFGNDGRLDFLLTGTVSEDCEACDPAGTFSQLWQNNTVQTNPPPAVITDPPASVTQASGALTARINPRGLAASAWFIWGDSTNYGQVTAAQPMGNGNAFTDFSQEITGLSPGKTYYYRAVGSNDQGLVFLGFEQRFTLTASWVVTYTGESFSPTAATFNGWSYSLNNLPAYGWFEWGLTPAYGQVTPVQFLGTGFNSGFAENLTGLEGGTTYYFRAVVSNSLGVAYGSRRTMVTPIMDVCAGSLSPTSRGHSYDGGTFSVYVLLQCDWTVINTNSWITITSATNGTAPRESWLTYTVTANPDPDQRSGNITIGGLTFRVTQQTKPPLLAISPPQQSVLGGGTASFIATGFVPSPFTYQWQFNGVPLTNGNGISGASTANLVLTGVQYSQAGNYRLVAKNPAGTTVGFSSWATLTVTCGFNLSANNASFSSLSTTGMVTLNAATTDCPWNVVNTNAWVSILSSIINTGPKTVAYAVAANPTTMARSGNITIADKTFTITQAAGPVPNAPISLVEVLDTEGTLSWNTVGTPAWFGQTFISHDGVDAAQSGPVGHDVGDGAAVTLQTTVTGPGTISFWWKVSSETNGDYLKFFINGVQQTRISGEVDWQQKTFAVPSGAPVLKWTYAKNYYGSVGQDRGWLDQVQFVPSNPCNIAISPTNRTHSSNISTGLVSVSTSAGCSWTVVNTNSWVEIVSGANGAGNGVIDYLLTENFGAPRSGNFVVGDQLFTITQLAYPTNALVSFAEALDTMGTSLAWDTIGEPTWFGQTSISHDGVDAAQSGPVGHSAAVTVLTTVNGPGIISFWWKVSSEADKDFLKFFVNGVQQTRISGEVNWELRNYTLPAGVHVLKWTYSKNVSGSAGLDRGWVDQVRFLPGTSPCSLTLSHSNATHPSDGGTGIVNVVVAPGCVWNITSADWWIIPTAGGGESNGFVRYTLYANSSATARTGVINIAGQPFTIVQQGRVCAYSLSPTSRTHTSAAGTAAVDVITQAGCTWNNVINTNAWVTIVACVNGQVIYSISENTTSFARNGNILIVGQLFSITQSATPAACPVTLSPGNASHPSSSSTGLVSVAAASACAWGVYNPKPWVSIVSGSSGTGNGSVTYIVAANSTPYARSADIQIADQIFYVTQAAGSTNPPSCTISISPGSRTHGPGSETGTVGVTAQVGCWWWVFNSNAWVTIASPSINSSNSGNGQVIYSVSQNTTSFARSGNISIGGRLFSISQSGAPDTNLIALAEALDTAGTAIVWNTSQSNPWLGQTNVTHDGVDAARSGPIGDSSSSGLQTGITGPGTLTFWWKVSSEPNNDTLRFHVNGTEQSKISGEVDWQQRTVTLGAGLHWLELTYIKNGSIAAGQDRAWIDQFQFVPGTNSNCGIALSPTNRMHEAADATNTVTVTTGAGCPWNVVETSSWITILSGLTNWGNGTMTYRLAPNTDAPTRTASINIGGRQFLVTQAGTSLSGANGARLQFMGRTGTNATLSVQGEAGKMYVVECSEDLIQWIPISTNSAPSTVTDAAVGNAPHRFYRTVEIP